MMRNLITILLLAIFTISCGDEKEISTPQQVEKVTDSIQTYEGEFIYLADAAVLRGRDFIYEVNIDSMSQILADSVRPYKNEDFEMIPVRVKGKVVPNTKSEGLDEVIEIREILEILAKEKVKVTQE